jgi:tetratricopeptide (TPR) repeat protein
MSQPNVPGGPGNTKPTNLQLSGGAAIIAPPNAFPSGVPGNALVVVPLRKPPDELLESLKKGPVAVDPEQMWKLLGFNGPAVQVQDAEGRPIAIGLEDLLSGLEKHWQENKQDLDRGRLYAQELMKHGRFERAEKVLAYLVASGGAGEDWVGLGVAQSRQKKWDEAEGTLKGAQNLLQESPIPSLELAKVYAGKEDRESERTMVERAINVDPNSVDAWAYLFSHLKEHDGEEAALERIEELAQAEPNKRTAAPYVAVQGVYAAAEETRDKALDYAERAVRRNPNDTLALVSLSALYGQKGDLGKIVELLQPHEAKMSSDVRLANNYFEALFQRREIDKVTRLLNALSGSPRREVKQFAAERSRAVAQFLQQQQQQLARAQQRSS